MSEDALSRAERINALTARWRQKVAPAASRTPSQLVDLLAENPYCTVNRVAQRLDVAFTTAQRAVERLLKLSILKQTTDSRRGRVFCATAIMDILDEPAKLKPDAPG